MDTTEMRRIAKGDAEAFSRLDDPYRDRIFGFAYRMLGSQSTAEDVTHETFLVLIEHPTRFRPKFGSMLTFLCTVARHSILNHYRRQSGAIEEFFDENDLGAIKDDCAIDPLDALLDRELGARVSDLIARLPPLQREVIVLREFQELTYEEISIVVGANVNVIKARLFRARQTLGKRLAPYLVSKKEEYYELHKS